MGDDRGRFRTRQSLSYANLFRVPPHSTRGRKCSLGHGSAVLQSRHSRQTTFTANANMMHMTARNALKPNRRTHRITSRPGRNAKAARKRRARYRARSRVRTGPEAKRRGDSSVSPEGRTSRRDVHLRDRSTLLRRSCQGRQSRGQSPCPVASPPDEGGANGPVTASRAASRGLRPARGREGGGVRRGLAARLELEGGKVRQS